MLQHLSFIVIHKHAGECACLLLAAARTYKMGAGGIHLLGNLN